MHWLWALLLPLAGCELMCFGGMALAGLGLRRRGDTARPQIGSVPDDAVDAEAGAASRREGPSATPARFEGERR